MTGYQLFRFYTSMKLHFTTENYDVFANRGAVKLSVESFNKRKDAAMFEKLARKFTEERDAVRFLVANFAKGNDSMIWGDWEAAQGNLIEWSKHKQSLSKVFRDDIDYLQNKVDLGTISESTTIINCTEIDICGIIKEWKQGKITIETVCLVCEMNPGLLENWKSVSSLNLVYGSDFLRIKKLIPFVKVNESIQKTWHEFAEDLNERKIK